MGKVKLRDVLEEYIMTLKLKAGCWIKPGSKHLKRNKRLNFDCFRGD